MLTNQPSDSLVHYKLINDNSNNNNNNDINNSIDNNTNNKIVIIITLKGYYDIDDIYK